MLSPSQGMAPVPMRPMQASRVGGRTQPLHDMAAAPARPGVPTIQAPFAAPVSPAADGRAERLIRIVAVLVVLLGVAFAVILALIIRSL